MTIIRNVRRLRLSELQRRKLQERSAVLYGRELERWNSRFTFEARLS